MTNANAVKLVTSDDSWGDVHEQVWRHAVEQAMSPIALMECLLVLESAIDKAWFHPVLHRVLMALPSFHFATV